VKLMDFGLARSGNEVGLTMTGTTVGSLDFMSPEQVKSQPTDERSDLYSVGVSLYQMVTRQRMFRATSGYSIMEAHVKETPRPPIEIQPTLPKSVSDLIMMSVAKDPAQRFQTADAFRSALSQIRASLPQQAGQAAVTMGELPPQAAPPGQPPTSRPPRENVRATPEAVMAPPAPAKGGRGLVLGVVAVVFVVAMAGAWVYKSRQHNEPAAADTSNAPISTSPPATNLPAQNAGTSAQQPPAPETASVNTSNPPQVSAPDVPPRNSGSKRISPSSSAGLTPGGSAPDSQAQEQAQEQAAAALAQKKLLDDMETESDHLESRAAAVESSLDTLEQQMHRDGLGLRGDMVASR